MSRPRSRHHELLRALAGNAANAKPKMRETSQLPAKSSHDAACPGGCWPSSSSASRRATVLSLRCGSSQLAVARLTIPRCAGFTASQGGMRLLKGRRDAGHASRSQRGESMRNMGLFRCRLPGRSGARCSARPTMSMAGTMECSEENVEVALQAARSQWPDMFGQV